jgi:hypothetical protein
VTNWEEKLAALRAVLYVNYPGSESWSGQPEGGDDPITAWWVCLLALDFLQGKGNDLLRGERDISGLIRLQREYRICAEAKQACNDAWCLQLMRAA